MSDDENKVVELKGHKRKQRYKADDQTMTKTWQALWEVWCNYATDVHSRKVEGELCLSGEPSAVFCVLSEKLIEMAQSAKVENDEILDTLLNAALIFCEPKGRLYQLLHKASDLLEYGDEDESEKMFRKLHAEGKITDEQLVDNLQSIMGSETINETTETR
jgi:hypothetical protein